jgi:3-oxoacyl-[acyl-carrier-protein] synthase-3
MGGYPVNEYGIGVVGTGHFIPERIETNEELCKNLTGVSPEWIVEKTGIKARRIASETDTASGFAYSAAIQALNNAHVNPEQLGLIVVCTFSGDYIFPHVSANLHRKLGAKKAQTFDLQACCAGFVSGLVVAADRMKMEEEIQYALVVSVELVSRYIDKTDVNSAIYLSDGAGAAVLAKVGEGYGLLASDFHTDSSTFEAVRLCGGGSSFPMAARAKPAATDFMQMNGLATWKQAVTFLPVVTRNACRKSGVSIHDIDLYLFHQANLNLIDYVVRKFGLTPDKTYTNVEEIGNTGSASLAIVLSEAEDKGLLKNGDKIVLAAVGAGFSFGASVWRWGHV